MCNRSLAWSVLVFTVPAAAQTTTRESANSVGNPQAIGFFSSLCDLSSDGRFVLFSSDAPNLVPGDASWQTYELFLRDRVQGTTVRAGLNPFGTEPNDVLFGQSVSTDGRWIVFDSRATDLVFGDTNGKQDVFLRDMSLGSIQRLSISSAGDQANGDSTSIGATPDGRFVLFGSSATNLDASGDTGMFFDPFLRDIGNGTTVRLPLVASGFPNGESSPVDLSGDGRYALFTSTATNLDPADASPVRDLYLHDVVLGTTELISVSVTGTGASDVVSTGAVSDDGRYVVFASNAWNLVPSDNNTQSDVFLRDRSLGTTVRLSMGVGGTEIDHWADLPNLSADGRWAVFSSWASNLVVGDTNGLYDQFLCEIATGSIERITVGPNGTEIGGDTGPAWSAISSDGNVVAYDGGFVGVVPSQIYANDQVYVHDRSLFAPVNTYCTAKVNSASCTPYITSTGSPRMTGDDVFFVVAQNVLKDKFGVFFWGHASTAVPFGGGTLCVKSPVVRTTVQNSGNVLGMVCSGNYSFHFTQSYAQSEGIQPGDTIYGQYWYRDPAFSAPNNIGLTDAIRFAFIP
ncbi:MAG: hypothetical protein L6Q99_13640 [Planctomycetes bacterium]|nr:hypothetical protein [Planctomycetota bacterium]